MKIRIQIVRIVDFVIDTIYWSVEICRWTNVYIMSNFFLILKSIYKLAEKPFVFIGVVTVLHFLGQYLYWKISN
jgi:hypothetical protein